MPLRQLLRHSAIWDAYKSFATYPDYWYWQLRGSPLRHVPHIVKQRALLDYARSYKLKVMVETGTNLGQMIAGTIAYMDEIWSIELADGSYQNACRRFAGQGKVHLVHGDSGTKMFEIAPKLSRPCLFWLDAHDGDRLTPIREELDAIASHLVSGSVFLIDDSPCFDGRNQYPTMEWVREFTRTRLPGYRLENAMNIIRILPEPRER
jgi:hypothetical protein